MSSTVGEQIQMTIFGASHGAGVGVVLSGLPAGLPVDRAELARFLARRAPGQGPWATSRRESDAVEFLSGLYREHTDGSPLAALIRNENTRSGDYDNLRRHPRPGHADYTAEAKWGGWQDPRGGGHFSGRLTAPLCLAGGLCRQFLRREGVAVGAHILRLGGLAQTGFDAVRLTETALSAAEKLDFPVEEAAVSAQMQAAIAEARRAGDSLGGVIECAAIGLPAGLGDPMFHGMENRIAQLVFGIPAVKGLSFGAGFAAAEMRGSAHNDPFFRAGDGSIRTRTNHHGGILGGITSGMPLLFQVAVKPTPSIARPQETLSLESGRQESLQIHGRHDPCIVPRAVPCVEAAAAFALYDALLQQRVQEPILNTGGESDVFGNTADAD